MKKTILKKSLLALFSILLILSAVSCDSADSSFDYYSMLETESMGFDDNGKLQYVTDNVEVYADESADGANDIVYTERKIIYSSSYEISTEEYEKSISVLDSLCRKYGAYYERAENYGEKTEYTSRRAVYTVRIPKNNYKAFTSEAGTVGTITHSSEQNKDITEQYFDTEARLGSAKIREERLLEILSNAKSLDDVLALERELADVRYEIESYSGTLRKYDSLVSYSTATFTIREVKKVVDPVTEKTALGKKLSSALESGFDTLYECVSVVLMIAAFFLPGFLLAVLPLVIIIIIIVIIVKRKKKKNKMK